MKLVIAIFKPFKMEEVREAVEAVGIGGMTVTETRGFGRQKGRTELYRGVEHSFDFLPKIRVEIAVPDDRLELLVEAIQVSARTGKIGDGKIFVLPFQEAVRIRTGESSERAL